MSRKFKKLVRSVSEKSGVSHAGAVNLLRRGAPPAPRPLDPVLIREGAVPVFGEPTHEAGIVSAVLPDGTVVVTPAWPRMTLGGLSFYRHEKLVRYRAEDVRPYRLEKGERFARFVESVFDEVSYDPEAAYTTDETPWLFRKSAEAEAFIVSEDADSLLSVRKPHKVVIPLWSISSPMHIRPGELYPSVSVVEDGVVVAHDAVKMIRAVRERMIALMACTIFPSDLLVDGPPLPDLVPDDCSWVIDDIDDIMTTDVGMVLDPSKVRKCSFLSGRYACGTGKVGRYVVTPGSRGILLLRSDVTVVSLRSDLGRRPA